MNKLQKTCLCWNCHGVISSQTLRCPFCGEETHPSHLHAAEAPSLSLLENISLLLLSNLFFWGGLSVITFFADQEIVLRWSHNLWWVYGLVALLMGSGYAFIISMLKR